MELTNTDGVWAISFKLGTHSTCTWERMHAIQQHFQATSSNQLEKLSRLLGWKPGAVNYSPPNYCNFSDLWQPAVRQLPSHFINLSLLHYCLCHSHNIVLLLLHLYHCHHRISNSLPHDHTIKVLNPKKVLFSTAFWGTFESL